MGPLLLVLLSATPVSVVVLDARALAGAEPGQAAVVAEEIASAMPSSAFKVTTAAQLTAVLGLERQRQLLGCGEESSSCAAELANALGADVVVQSTLSKVGDSLRCTVVFVSGRDGTALERVAVDGSAGQIFERLREEVGATAAKLFTRLRPGNQLEAGKPGFRRYFWIPGVVALGVGVAAGTMFAVEEGSWRTLNSREGRVTDPFGLAEAGRTQQTLAFVFAGTAGVALLATAAVVIFGAPTEARVVVAPVVGGGGGGLVFSGVLP